MEEHRVLGGFLCSNMEKLQLRILGIQVISPKATQRKTWREFAKLSMN
jgi:hypothetical protein